MADAGALGRESAEAQVRLGFHLPADLAESVRIYAEEHGLQPPEALRYLVEAGLAAEAHAMLEAARFGDSHADQEAG
jgi:hypothetical protein